MPGTRREKLRKVSPADFVTLGAAVCGSLAVFFLLTRRDLGLGSALIVLAMLLDGLDGAVARRYGSKHQYGQILDSVSDSISFCVAPGVLIATAYWSSGTPVAVVAAVAVAVGGLGIVRLIRFAIWGHRLPTFSGLPTPATALLVTILVLLFPTAAPVPLAVGAVLSVLMVTPIPYPKVRGRRSLLFATTVAGLLATAGLVRFVAPASGEAASIPLLIGALLMMLGYLALGPLVGRRQNVVAAAAATGARDDGDEPADDEDDDDELAEAIPRGRAGSS